MPDREKVIKGVEHCFHGQECCGDIECPYYIEHLSDCCCLEECQENLKADVIALLKEQEAIVQCKDCKHGRRMKTENGIEVYCENNRIERIFCEQDWFCADGRRRDE